MAPSSTTTLTPTILSSTTFTVDEGGATTISAIHSDIIQTHLLTRLDGPTLASAACTSSQLYTLCTQDILWTNICHSTWPSTNTPRLVHLISTFPNGSRSFFSDSFPLLTNSDPISAADSPLNPDTSPSELISAVDLYYKGKLVFCKDIETETVSGWFRCSPFRLDLLDPKDVVSTSIRFPGCEDDYLDQLEKDLALSWIMIEPIGRRAVNLSSHKAVSVERHWLSGEIQVRFATILTGEKGSSTELVQCGIVITCGASEGGELQLREVSLQVENMDGKHLNGKDSLAILGRVLAEGKRRGKRRREEGEGRKISYQDYLQRKRERKARKLRTEGTLDTLCMAFGVLVFSSFWMFVLCR